MRKGVILSIDDDENLQTVVGQYLGDDGYTVIAALDSKTAVDEIQSAQFDVILLDLVLPDGEGTSLIPKFRAQSKAPIIVVSGKSDTTEKVVCLELGADDYITKPFEMRELSARIKAALRRANDNIEAMDAEEKKSDQIIFEGWCLDRAQYQLFDPGGKSAGLTTGEFRLLEALIQAPNRALSRERLFELTHEGEYDSYDRSIDIQVGRLRKKLHDKGDLIKTVRGIGYMFAGRPES